MENRYFGNTDLECSSIGFGTWEMGTTQYGEIDVRDAVRAVEMAIDHGITPVSYTHLTLPTILLV